MATSRQQSQPATEVKAVYGAPDLWITPACGTAAEEDMNAEVAALSRLCTASGITSHRPSRWSDLLLCLYQTPASHATVIIDAFGIDSEELLLQVYDDLRAAAPGKLSTIFWGLNSAALRSVLIDYGEALPLSDTIPAAEVQAHVRRIMTQHAPSPMRMPTAVPTTPRAIWKVSLRYSFLVAPNGMSMPLSRTELTLMQGFLDDYPQQHEREEQLLAANAAPHVVSRLRRKAQETMKIILPLISRRSEGYVFAAPLVSYQEER